MYIRPLPLKCQAGRRLEHPMLIIDLTGCRWLPQKLTLLMDALATANRTNLKVRLGNSDKQQTSAGGWGSRIPCLIQPSAAKLPDFFLLQASTPYPRSGGGIRFDPLYLEFVGVSRGLQRCVRGSSASFCTAMTSSQHLVHIFTIFVACHSGPPANDLVQVLRR